MSGPKRDFRTLLATGGLLLIPLAALWLLASPRPPQVGKAVRLPGGSTTGGPSRTTGGFDAGEPPLPPHRVAAGAPTQTEWTLLAATILPRSGYPSPPSSVAPPAGGPQEAARNPFLRGEAGALGLWIGVRGGLGVRTLRVPADGLSHAYPLGGAVFTVQSFPRSNGYTFQWTGAGGLPLPGGRPPYQAVFQTSPGVQIVTLMPAPLAHSFRVTAQPLSAGGRPTGRPVVLVCQPVTTDVLFAQIPPGDAATCQFQVTAARTGAIMRGAAKAGAAWRLAGLPPPAQTRKDAATPAARLGPFDLRAVAAEAEDTSGSTDPANWHPPGPAGAAQNVGTPQNMDGHLWTGVPTVRYRLTARAVTPPVPGQSWLLRLDRVRPQWGAALPPPTAGKEQALGLFPLSEASLGPGARVLQDGEVGAAYSGQQRWLRLDGAALRRAERTETVTFHDAEVVWDAGFGGDRIVWRHPETQTTASGISVTVLNGRSGKRDAPDPQPSSPSWWYDRGNAELLLAWHLPPGFVSGARATLDAPRVAGPPQGIAPPGAVPMRGLTGAGPLLTSWDSLRPDPYAGAVAPPGGVDARPLTQIGYSFLRLSVWGPQTPKRTMLPRTPLPPETLPPYSWREGPEVFSATPLPRHLSTLSLQITLREEQEQRPVHLLVPVRPILPPGADTSARKVGGKSKRITGIEMPAYST